MSDENVNWWDKARMWAEQNKPIGEKHPLAKATYKMEDKGPHDNDFRGVPAHPLLWLCIFFLGSYVVYWFWYGYIQEPLAIDFDWFILLTWGTIGAVFLIALGVVSYFIDLHKGIAGAYKWFLNLTLRYMDRREIRRPEFRIKRDVEIWNPKTGGLWRSVEEFAQEIEADEKQLEEIMRVQQQLAEARKKIKELESPKPAEGEEFKPFKALGKQFRSIRDLQTIMETALGEVEPPREKDDVEEALAVKRRWIRIAKAIELDWFITLLICEGDIYPIVISEFSLFGTSEIIEKRMTEFVGHTLSVRSFAPYVSREVQNVAIGEAVYLTDYAFYKIPSDEYLLTGVKEADVKFSPIIFITGSDGQAERQMEYMRRNEIKTAPISNEVIQAELSYNQTVADLALEKLKLTTSRLRTKVKSDKELRREMEYERKETTHRALEKTLRIEKSQEKGGWKVTLFSRTGLMYLFYIIGIISIMFFVSYFLHFYANVGVPWFPPTNATQPDEGGWEAISLLWEVIAG